MVIESLDLKNYRNYDILDMNFDKNVNIIYGDNAQGKTNILESIYMCATSRSHRGSKDKEIIRFGESESHIKANVLKNNINYRTRELKQHRKNHIARSLQSFFDCNFYNRKERKAENHCKVLCTVFYDIFVGCIKHHKRS